MISTEALTIKLNRLPAEKQREVADFVDFLLSRMPAELQPDVTPGVTENSFEQALNDTAGVWPEAVDGITYENQLRQQWRTRS